jgi:hypothetical protein
MIKNGKKVNEVYQTKDYSIFKFRDDNRIINKSHVKNIANNMKVRGWEKGSYVVINKKGEIIDGQHRVSAAMETGVSIQYILETTAGFETIRNLNSRQKNWAITDHIHGFVVEGNPHYVKLNNFMKQYPELKPTEAMMMCTNSLSGSDRETFESGRFVTKNMDKAVEWAMNIMELKPYFEGYNRSTFVRALIKIMTRCKDFSFEDFVRKVKLRPSNIHFCGSVDEYIRMIEEIYNFSRNKSGRINLRNL